MAKKARPRPRVDDEGALRCRSCNAKLGQVSDRPNAVGSMPTAFGGGEFLRELVLTEELHLEHTYFERVPGHDSFKSPSSPLDLLDRERQVLRFGVPKRDASDAPAWKRSIPWSVPRRAPNKQRRLSALDSLIPKVDQTLPAVFLTEDPVRRMSPPLLPVSLMEPTRHPVRLMWPPLEIIEIHCLGCGRLLRT